jgi:hypothetical protein
LSISCQGWLNGGFELSTHRRRKIMLALKLKRGYDSLNEHLDQSLKPQGDREEKMNQKRSIRLIIPILCLTLLLSLAVSSVQARPLSTDLGADPAVPSQPETTATPVYNAALFTASWGTTPDTMISCDPGNNLLSQVNPGQVRSTNSLQASACRKQAAQDALFAHPEVASATSGSGSSGCGSGYGVSGDGRSMKIYSGYSDTRYVYLQCGKKVAEYGPPTCSCNSGFRYGYSCKKPPTIYITLPCYH